MMWLTGQVMRKPALKSMLTKQAHIRWSISALVHCTLSKFHCMTRLYIQKFQNSCSHVSADLHVTSVETPKPGCFSDKAYVTLKKLKLNDIKAF